MNPTAGASAIAVWRKALGSGCCGLRSCGERACRLKRPLQHLFICQPLSLLGAPLPAPRHPKTGSFVINPRLQRLFMTLAVNFPGQDSLMKIYGTFLQGHLSRFKEDVQARGRRGRLLACC